VRQKIKQLLDEHRRNGTMSGASDGQHSARVPTVDFQMSAQTALRGQDGAACATHGECKPGVCCHRVHESDSAASMCVAHRLPASSVCTHSCQCANGMHCFRPFANSTAAMSHVRFDSPDGLGDSKWHN
jgi:hypothetical protein